MAIILKSTSLLQVKKPEINFGVCFPSNKPIVSVRRHTRMAAISTESVGLSETFTKLKKQGKAAIIDGDLSTMYDLSLSSYFQDNIKLHVREAWIFKRGRRKKVALIPYITAGDPDLSTTAEALKVLDSCGSDIIELGVPYSDPLADGPVIQAAATRSLAKGTNLDAIISMLEEVVPQLSCPIALFTYYNPILKRGTEGFMSTIKDIGVHGLVVPDVPLEETETLRLEAKRNGIELVLLTTPTTPTNRMKAIVDASEGFVYLVSSVGVTGARASVSDKVQALLQEIKEETTKPVAVGFGISKPEHVEQLVGWGADGVIIGSAMVKLLGEAKSPQDGLKELENFTNSLRSALPCKHA